jgi:monoamine oxidase
MTDLQAFSHSQQEQHAIARTARIAIVGAGIAGLHAALTLHDAGLSCRVYEASNRIGGRMHSDTTSWAHGVVSEWCGEFVDSDHHTIWQLIQRFGLRTIDLQQYSVENAAAIFYLGNRYYSREALQNELQKLSPILEQQIQAAGFSTTCTHFTEEGYRLDHLSVYDWIEQYVAGGHSSPLGKMLDRSCSGFYGLDTHQQSALNLVYFFGGRSSEGRPVIGNAMSSSKIAGGNQQLPLAMARSLPADCIQLQHRLVAIKRNRDDTITLSFTTTAGETTVVCDHVILALPFSVLRHVDYAQAGFDALKCTAISQLSYGTISKLFLQFDTPYWYQQGPWPRPNNGFIVTDLQVQTFWDVSLGQTEATGLLVNYTSGKQGASYAPASAYTTAAETANIEQYARRSLLQLEHVFPGISTHYTGQAALSYPAGDPYLLGSYACWSIGQYTLFAGYERERQGPIHFAGEHCSLNWQGFMEGAAREGARAAQEILCDYGLIERKG